MKEKVCEKMKIIDTKVYNIVNMIAKFCYLILASNVDMHLL